MKIKSEARFERSSLESFTWNCTWSTLKPVRGRIRTNSFGKTLQMNYSTARRRSSFIICVKRAQVPAGSSREKNESSKFYVEKLFGSQAEIESGHWFRAVLPCAKAGATIVTALYGTPSARVWVEAVGGLHSGYNASSFAVGASSSSFSATHRPLEWPLSQSRKHRPWAHCHCCQYRPSQFRG
jgi:hypothetical protein